MFSNSFKFLRPETQFALQPVVASESDDIERADATGELLQENCVSQNCLKLSAVPLSKINSLGNFPFPKFEINFSVFRIFSFVSHIYRALVRFPESTFFSIKSFI